MDLVKESDADVLRDNKCIPVARMILNDIAVDMVPEETDSDPNHIKLVGSILTREFEADLNITTEVPYIFQLVLGAMSGLNVTVQGCTVSPIDNKRYRVIARKLLAILATANVSLTKTTPAMVEQEFAPVKEQINALFASEQLTILELKYIMDTIFDSFKRVHTLTSASIEKNVADAEIKLFGVESMSDVTLKQVDTILKA